ncbi:tripartite tricarboxylate transporter substrate binding protein [Tardiphaga sp.]|uniref:Bug family tripartite tricarboxylate transporter substrate binding protein n=1 Tax=Tardiphaga sp. TaxID=1926292 RepID=UPI0025F6B865|nr:tripartite tricarboxylate transporter substrate binding protein [Tardiphaga sp.]
MFRLKFVARAMFALGVSVLPAQAQDDAGYPARSIKIIVAFPPGGGPDPIARIVASSLERRLGKPVVVENMPGGSGAIAARAAARAAADGYTLLLADMSFIVAPHTMANFGVKPLKDFEPIGWAATSPFTMIVSAAVPASNLAEYINIAKAKPGEMMIGHAGIGSTPHLAAVSFVRSAAIEPRYIPYRGASDAMSNAMSGLISSLFSSASLGISASGNDKLKVLGLTGNHRLKMMPNVPTFAESGIKMRGFEDGAWFGILAPAGTPQPIIAKLNGALNDMKSDTDMKVRFDAIGAEFKGGSSKAYHDFMVEQDVLWATTLDELGVKPE